MSKIKIFALGGLGENGKNLYCVEIDDSIIVLDVGFKYPDETMYGIDIVAPDFSYLKKNRKKIRGLFLSHAHVDNIGAIDGFAAVFPEVPIYGSEWTITVAKSLLEEEGVKSDKLHVVKNFQTVKAKTWSIFALPLTHSTPGHYGYAINTEQGIIFYATDYIFDQSASSNYATDIGKLAYLGKQGVLCMLGESLGASGSGHTSPHHRINEKMADFLDDASRRAFVMVYASNFYRIQEILDEAKAASRLVAIHGRRLNELLLMAIEKGVVDFPKENIIPIFNVENIKDQNILVLISGERDRPFSGMERILSGNDKYIKLTKDDSVYIAAKPVPGTEDTAITITNELYRSGAKITQLNKNDVRGNHASCEDVMMMVNLLNPKYYVPIKGEYRHLVASKEAALRANVPADNILLIENGDVVKFENGVASSDKKIEVGDAFVDGTKIKDGDVGVILKDRELLKENGIVIVGCAVSYKTKEIIAGPEILTRGFIYIKENMEFMETMKSVCRETIERVIADPNLSYTDLRQSIREDLAELIYQDKGRKPMIITLIQTL